MTDHRDDDRRQGVRRDEPTRAAEERLAEKLALEPRDPLSKGDDIRPQFAYRPPDSPPKSQSELARDMDARVLHCVGCFRNDRGDFALYPNTWSKCYPSEKAALLDGLEDRLAAAQQRDPVPVTPVPLPAGYRGAFDDRVPEILVNHYALDGLRSPHPIEAVRTYLHEARHAYQFDVIQNPERHPEVSKATQLLWKLYWPIKIDPATGGLWHEMLYKLSPLERDARRFADEIVKAMYEQK